MISFFEIGQAMRLKDGDLLVCIRRDHYHITYSKVYRINYTCSQEVHMIGDSEMPVCGANVIDRFVLITKDDLSSEDIVFIKLKYNIDINEASYKMAKR